MNPHLPRFLFFIILYLVLLPLSQAGVDLPVPYLAQPDNQTCLPTCLTMTLHYMDKAELTSATVLQLQKRTRYDRYNIPKIVQDYGLYALPCWYELGWNADTLKKELDAGYPVITGCDLGRAGHFVLITGYTDDGKWILNDPTGKALGYPLGGPHLIAEWEALNWRGGVFIHPAPFAEAQYSARVVKTTAPKWMTPGETGELRIEVKNNGKNPWPQPLFLEVIEPSFTKIALRQSPFYVKENWISASRVARIPKTLPGDIASFSFQIRAPQVTRPGIFREYFTLLDDRGRRLSEEAASGPGLFDMSAKIHVESRVPSCALPMVEEAPNGKPALPWLFKFGAFEPAPDKNHPAAMRLLTPGQKYDVAWLGDRSWTDYKVESMVYCEYRPGEISKGFDRSGIFVRDNGDHAADTRAPGVAVEYGESCCMTYDTDDGRVRAGNIRNGMIDDFHHKPFVYLKQGGWHKFSIRAKGETITYELDDQPFHTEEDDHFTSGSCGVFYSTRFAEGTLSRGIRFDSFKVLP